MNSFTPRDYQLDNEYRDRKFGKQLNQQVSQGEDKSSDDSVKFSRRIIGMAILALSIIGIFIMIPSAKAQTMKNADASYATNIELALMMGTYYFNQERYEEAIEQFEIAIDAIPEAYFEIAPEQAIVFWQLGEALENAGYLTDALDSYQRFLELAGEDATDYTIAYIADLQEQIDAENA